MKRQRTRWIAFLLSVVMLLSTVPPVYAASYTAALIPSATTVAKGGTVTVAVKLSGAVTCSMYGFALKHPADFTVQSATVDGGEVQADKLSAQKTFITGDGAFAGITTLAEITFFVPEDMEPGEYEISIEVEGTDYIQLIDSNDQITSVSPATVQVTEGASQPSVPAGSYSAQITAPAAATVGDTDVEFTIQIDGDRFSAAQMTFTYDHQRLELVNVTPGSWQQAAEGTVTVVDFGAEKTVPAWYTLTFEALKDGVAAVTLDSVLLGNADTAASENATAAVITASTASVNIAKRTYSVTLPDIFVGERTVTDGESYTFEPADSSNYLYSNVQASVGGGAPQMLTADAQGKYTVANVTGNVVITGERTARTHTVTFRSDTGVSLPEAETVTYGVDYSFTIPSETNYDVTVTSIKKGEIDLPFTISGRTVTIAGADLTGDIIVTLDRERNNATVQIPASLSGLLSGGKTAVPGEDYTVILTPDDRYIYTVTAKINGATVTLTQNGNQYTIAGTDIEAGDEIVFTVEQTVRTDKLTAKHYLQLNGTALYLVQNNVARETENVYIYNGTEMFWSAKYNAYCCLVMADNQQDAISGMLELEEGADREVAYGTDTNLSGTTDINDAQFVYNLYQAKYDSFTGSVTMEKVLCADVNGDGTVNIMDAQVIVDTILGAR